MENNTSVKQRMLNCQIKIAYESGSFAKIQEMSSRDKHLARKCICIHRFITMYHCLNNFILFNKKGKNSFIRIHFNNKFPST